MATLLCISTVRSCISRGIIVYTENQSFCPFLGIGSPHPLTRKRVCLPPWTQRGEEQHSLVGEGPNADDWKESLVLWILCIEPEVLAVL